MSSPSLSIRGSISSANVSASNQGDDKNTGAIPVVAVSSTAEVPETRSSAEQASTSSSQSVSWQGKCLSFVGKTSAMVNKVLRSPVSLISNFIKEESKKADAIIAQEDLIMFSEGNLPNLAELNLTQLDELDDSLIKILNLKCEDALLLHQAILESLHDTSIDDTLALLNHFSNSLIADILDPNNAAGLNEKTLSEKHEEYTSAFNKLLSFYKCSLLNVKALHHLNETPDTPIPYNAQLQACSDTLNIFQQALSSFKESHALGELDCVNDETYQDLLSLISLPQEECFEEVGETGLLTLEQWEQMCNILPVVQDVIEERNIDVQQIDRDKIDSFVHKHRDAFSFMMTSIMLFNEAQPIISKLLTAPSSLKSAGEITTDSSESTSNSESASSKHASSSTKNAKSKEQAKSEEQAKPNFANDQEIWNYGKSPFGYRPHKPPVPVDQCIQEIKNAIPSIMKQKYSKQVKAFEVSMMADNCLGDIYAANYADSSTKSELMKELAYRFNTEIATSPDAPVYIRPITRIQHNDMPALAVGASIFAIAAVFQLLAGLKEYFYPPVDPEDKIIIDEMTQKKRNRPES